MESVRLPVIFDDGELIAVQKPHDTLVQADPWYPRSPVLIEAIRYQAEQEKPELVRLGIGAGGLWSVTDLDPECQGPVLFARHREPAEALRSELGSEAFTFTFIFASKVRSKEIDFDCSLPLARHRQEARTLVSHTTGKKALTEFTRIGEDGPVVIYEARTNFPRRHQVLLHAMECGVPILGDTLYARDQVLLLSRLKRMYQPKNERPERPLYDGPACYLACIKLPDGRAIEAPPPQKWKGFVRQFVRHYRK